MRNLLKIIAKVELQMHLDRFYPELSFTGGTFDCLNYDWRPTFSNKKLEVLGIKKKDLDTAPTHQFLYDTTCRDCIFIEICDINSDEFAEFMKEKYKCKKCENRLHDHFALYYLHIALNRAKELGFLNLDVQAMHCCKCLEDFKTGKKIDRFIHNLLKRGIVTIEDGQEDLKKFMKKGW